MELVMTHGVSQQKDPLSQAILTSVNGLVEAQQHMFENRWNKAISIEDKIKEFEEGIKPDVIETITDPAKIQSISKSFKHCYKRDNANYSCLSNTMTHQANVGVFALLKE